MQDEPTRLWPPREADRLGRQQPRQQTAGAVLDAVPGLGAQFAREVPETHLIPRRPQRGPAREVLAHIDDARRHPEAFVATHVACTCGTMAPLERPWAKCPGGCGRFFMPCGFGARVAGPYPADPEAVADAA